MNNLTPGNAFEFALFVALALFIGWLWLRLLLHNPAKPNPRNPRRGGGTHDEPVLPDTNPYTGEQVDTPRPRQDEGMADTPRPVLSPRVITQGEYQRHELAWIHRADPDGTQEKPAEMPAPIEVTREFERIKR